MPAPHPGIRTRRRVAAWIAAAGMLAFALPAAQAQTAASADQLIADLKKGGLVIYFRHGDTGAQYADREKAVMGDCATQRNLNADGREQVAQLGRDFKALNIPVGKVLSSEFCRGWQHAEAMFGKGGYTVTADLSVPLSYPGVSEADRALNNTRINRLLSEVPPAGRNTVLVSHGVNVLLAAGYHPNTQGEAVIFRPQGQGRYTRLGSVLPGDWTRVAGAGAAKR